MQLVDGRLVFSPSDLNNHLECEHLSRLELAVAWGELARPAIDNPTADFIARKGEEHEAAYLGSLKVERREVRTIEFAFDWAAAAAATEEAVHEGADVIYQACFVDDGWRGFADFLLRQPDGTYEVVDTKLARHPKPYHVLQLCFYSEQVGRLQGLEPARMHLALGSGYTETYRPADFAAYYRRVRSRFLDFVGSGPPTEPYPVAHCGLCGFKPLCDAHWDRVDHLVRVARIRRDQIARLGEAGITTLEGLGLADPEFRVPQMPPSTFEALRDQASLQLHYRRTGRLAYRLLEPETERGFGLLPEPSSGDLFFDIEGDPFWESDRGLEYLFGLLWEEGGRPVFQPIWAHDRSQGREAFEELIDLFHKRLERDPALHIYHYAGYETAALKRLASQYGTREDELDELLRREVFVDLFAVVRQGLRASLSSYSIKKLEGFYMPARSADLKAGDDSILVYEEWQESREQTLLDAIAAYNEEDCLSTLKLRDWLLELRAEAGIVEWRQPPAPRELTTEAEEALEEREQLEHDLLAGGEELMAHLLGYHRREAKPVWWAFFDRLEKTPSELVDDSDSIGELEHLEQARLPPPKRSTVHTFSYPPQQHKLAPGEEVFDPETGESAGWIREVDDSTGHLQLVRGPSLESVDLPRALIPGGPWDDRCQRNAVMRLGRSIRDGDAVYRALRGILTRDLPHIDGHQGRIQTTDLEEMKQLVSGLDESHLFIQGPPGSGKTWTGARLVVHLLNEGKRVGVASTSHRAIHNLLDEIEGAANEAGVHFWGLKKSTEGNDESIYESRHIQSDPHIAPFVAEAVNLIAGTAWLFAREELERCPIDFLFIDEAGQVSLADALAMGTCARNLVLLGDPLQLAQVRQGRHPGGSGASVLEHLLGDAATISQDKGVFLELTRRMHPDVCKFISSAFYEGRLSSAEECAGQSTAAGTGLRYIAVDHIGNRQTSPEEALRVAQDIEAMLGAAYTDIAGETRPLQEDDFMVVAPYNAQVRCLREAVPAGVRVGTVDKFQGQEAAVVFFSMATSSGDDIPRNVEFLFSRNRLNVAVSRARCLGVLVASPRLLDLNCRTVEQMRLANALCLAGEIASSHSR
jgi:predicted RecB family nuclease